MGTTGPVNAMASPASERQDRAARAIASFVSGSGFALVSIALGFWATPKIVGWLGAERYGLSRALVDLFGYLALLEFGLGGASRPVFSKEVATGNPERKAIALSIVGRAYLRTTAWKLAIAVPLVAAAPSLIRIGHVNRTELVGAGAVLLLGTLVTPVFAIQALLGAEQRDYLNNLAMGLQNFAITLTAVLFAWWHWGIPGQAGAALVGSIVFAGVLIWVGRSTIAAALHARHTAEDDAHVLLRRLNLPTFLRTIVGRLSVASDRIIVAVLLGGRAVTGFQSTLRLTDAVFPFLAGIGNAAWPGMADIHARGDMSLFRKRLLEVTTTICGLAILFTSPVLVINEAFVNLWMGHGLFGGWVLTLIACGNVLLLALTNYWDWCFGSTTNIRAIVPLTIVSGTVNLAVSVLGTYWLGPMGPALGTVVAMGVVVVPWEAYLLNQQFETPLTGLALAVIRPLMLGAVYVLLCRFLTRGLLVERWDRLILIGAATAGGWGAIAWWTVFDSAARQLWRGRLARLVGRLRG